MQYVSPEDFVTEYMNAYKQRQTLEYLALHLGMRKPAVIGRASYLRKRGVELPYLNGSGRSHLNVSDLQRIVRKAMV